jgi:hypothetical protein
VALAGRLHLRGRGGGYVIRNLVIWNVVAAAVLGGVYGALAKHACWAVRTMYHYLPQLPDEARRDLTRALFTS